MREGSSSSSAMRSAIFITRVQASIQPENERSIALVRGAGFRKEGLRSGT